MIRAQIQLLASAAVRGPQPEPKGHERGQAKLHVPPPPQHPSCSRLGHLCRPAAGRHMSEPLEKRPLCSADRCALCEEECPSKHARRLFRFRNATQALPFFSSAHRRAHGNNDTNTETRSSGRARHANPSAAIPGRVSRLHAGHRQQCGR